MLLIKLFFFKISCLWNLLHTCFFFFNPFTWRPHGGKTPVCVIQNPFFRHLWLLRLWWTWNWEEALERDPVLLLHFLQFHWGRKCEGFSHTFASRIIQLPPSSLFWRTETQRALKKKKSSCIQNITPDDQEASHLQIKGGARDLFKRVFLFLVPIKE